ncbi:RNA transcription, translation and transport factor protein [Venturia canescens]|uniref:RNA transcription, translation and transport factor protein n=1 Tax=Venturia canescens TaxID=32260 RepID=UPI001C9C23C7|nr:RNA transcription, translation and transport factor protein [Venturia canescens]
MFKRRLKTLNYLDWDKVNGNEPQHFRKLVVWLEDQKIRHYTIQDREDLRNIGNEKWQNAFAKYLEDLECPIKTCSLDQLEWLLGLAIRLEFEDDLKKYQNIKGKLTETKAAAVPTIKSTNPLDNLDFESNEFKSGVRNVAQLLNVTQHVNHLITLDACSKLVCQRLNSVALANPSFVVVKGKPYPITEIDLGFNMGDRVLNNAAQALTLLYIQDLRNLQTKINEAIVSVQSITANPKTDTKLGKVGI